MSVLPTNSLETPRFCGVPTFMRLPMATDLSVLDAAIIGLPSDAGARFAPNAVRAMSIMLRPINPYRDNINVFDVLRVADAGVIPCAIGGDHSVTLAELRAVAKRHGPVALVQFDSHSDTWDKYFADKRYSAGTPFRRGVEENIIDPAHSIQIGLRGSLFQTTDITQSLDLGFEVVTTDAMFEMGIAALVERTAGRPTFITFDMDFVDPAAAPLVRHQSRGMRRHRNHPDLRRSGPNHLAAGRDGNGGIAGAAGQRKTVTVPCAAVEARGAGRP